ncbi:MAG: HK97-gp10 family putative phage morphogenesis protein [Brevundimonas sp.]|jgi:HK97 gp10 family phage protein
MANSRSVRVEGLKEIDHALAEIGRRATAKNVGRRALKTAAAPIDRDWRAKARVDTGALRESGGISTKLTRRQKAKHKKAAPVEMHVGPGGLAQAITEEFGTDDQAPHPFMRPAWDAHKHDLPSVIGGELWAEIEKAAQRAARKTARLAKAGG